MYYTYYVEVAMSNITMSIDDSLLKKARKIAVEHDSTISDLFRTYLGELARQEDIRKGFIADELDQLFGKSKASSQGERWSREDLHGR